MVHSQEDRFKNIEIRLKEITSKLIKRQNQNTKDLIIDDKEFQFVMAFCPVTTKFWRKHRVIEYIPKDGQFFYTIEAVNKMLVKEFAAVKKK